MRKGQGTGAAGLQDRSDRRARAGRAVLGAIWCRRSGYPTRRSGANASSLATDCTWSGTARHSRNGIHVTLITFGHPCPVSDLFGLAGRDLLDRMAIPDPWRRNVDASLELIDDLELQIAQLTVELRRQGADHRYIPLLVTAPGFGWINAYTVASEIGDIERFPSPTKLCGYA